MSCGDGPMWVRVPVEGGNDAYYWNPATQAVCWSMPSDLEVMWIAQRTSDGRFYFWNTRTRETTWDLPFVQKKLTGTSFKLPLSPNMATSGAGGWQFAVVAQGRGVPRASEPAGGKALGPGLCMHPPRTRLPEEWVEVRRPNQQAYYWNFHHSLSIACLPQGARAKWRGYSNSEGQWYYINTETGESVWVVPGMACDCCQQLVDGSDTIDSGWFQVGAAVILRDLESKASARYNDQLGQVFGYQNGRAIVMLPDCLGGTMLVVRVKNLSPLTKGTIVEVKRSPYANLSGEVGTVDRVNDSDVCYSVRMRDSSIRSVKPTRLVARSRLWNINTAQVPTWLQWRKEQDCLFIDSTGQHRRYSLHLPLGPPALAGEGSTKASPMLVYLHGTGGTSFFKHSKRLLKSTGLQFAAGNFIVVSPCCDWTWRETPKPWVTELVMALRPAEWVDHHRIYLTGCSMGGMGTWELASARPDLYAAIAPVAAHHKAEHESCLASSLQRMPTFIMHSESDETCPFTQEEALWTLLFDAEKNPYMQVNVARHLGHGTMYERAYCDDTVLYDWLLQHAR